MEVLLVNKNNVKRITCLLNKINAYHHDSKLQKTGKQMLAYIIKNTIDEDSIIIKITKEYYKYFEPYNKKILSNDISCLVCKDMSRCINQSKS